MRGSRRWTIGFAAGCALAARAGLDVQAQANSARPAVRPQVQITGPVSVGVKPFQLTGLRDATPTFHQLQIGVKPFSLTGLREAGGPFQPVAKAVQPFTLTGLAGSGGPFSPATVAVKPFTLTGIRP